MLSAASIKAARPRSRAFKIFDGRGLHLHVLPSGRKSFRVKYRWQGGERCATIGTSPELSLPDARARCDAIHDAIARGEDPALATHAGSFTFAQAANAWIEHNRASWSAAHLVDVESSLARHVFPVIGDSATAEIDAPTVLGLLRTVELTGARSIARRLRTRISSIYALAISEGHDVRDPSAIVAKAMRRPVASKVHPALTDLDDVRALFASFGQAPATPTRLAAQLLALTTVRLAAVRFARWDEFELDGNSPLWRVPAARMKLAVEKKADAANDHLVPLSAAAVEVLRAARSIAGSAPDQPGVNPVFVFPGRLPGRPIGEAAIGALHVAAGARGRHVPHGWRASFSTIMNERHRGDRAEIDVTLAHVPKEKVEAAYNRAEMLERRRWLLETWANYVCGC